MSKTLSGKGVWAVTAEHVAQAIQQAPLMGVTHVLAKVGDTPMFDDGVRRTVYYEHAPSACQQISAAGLVPMAWIFMRLLHPEEEAQLILRAFGDGYQGVILDVEDQCAGKHVAAQQLVSYALTHDVDPHRVYNCSFPNIDDHSSLPYAALNALCKGGLMPMSYAIFFRSDTTLLPSDQARTVIDEWTYAQYESFYGSLDYKPPMYPVLGPFHEVPELRLLTATEFQPWLDRLAAHEPTFFSLYAIHTIRPDLYPVIRDFRLGRGEESTKEVPTEMWATPLHGVVLRASPGEGSAPRGAAPYGRQLSVLEKAQVNDQTWYRVRKTGTGIEGWVGAQQVATRPPGPYPDPGPEEEFPPGWLKYVWPAADNVNLRRNTDASSPASLIGQVGRQARLRLVDEDEQRTGRARLNVPGLWFHVQVEPGGPVGYISAGWVQAPPDPRVEEGRAEHFGINLNPEPPSLDPVNWPRDPHRTPTAEELQGVGWVRFVFKDSAVPDLTLEQSFTHYGNIVDSYREAGIKTLLILNWESFWGHAPWDHGDWPGYAQNFANYVRDVALRFRGRVAAYQIWNEGDNPHDPGTSIYVTPEIYAPILLQAGRAIKEVDPEALVVFGGVCGGAQNNVNYVQQARAAMQGEWPVDAVGMHPYGQYPIAGVPEIPHLTEFGKLYDYLGIATQGLSGVPVWITEIGVPIDDRNLADDSSYHWEEIAAYLRGVYAEVERHYRGQVPVVFWFAWSNKMRGSGIVDTHDDPKEPIYRAFFDTARGTV
jgi:hypothetical protein